MLKKKLRLILTVAILTLFIIIVIGLNASSNHADVEAIKNILIKSETIADKAYIDAKNNLKLNTLEEKRYSLIVAYTNEFNTIFSENIGNLIKKRWIDDQFTNVTDGPDCIDCGITDIKIKDISISDSSRKATVTAVLTKYLIDRVNKNGKCYLDKMESEVLTKATLIKVENNWLIDEYTSNPQNGEVSHILTEVK